MKILKRIFTNLLKNTDLRILRPVHDMIDWTQPFIGIMGQRGVGKTTLMLQHVKLTDPEGKHSFYVSLDNLWFADNSLLDLVEQLSGEGVTHFYFDEVHHLSRWEQQLKNINDGFPDLQIVFSGSSLLEIDYSIGDLSRRASLYNVEGLSFREFLVFEGFDNVRAYTLNDILYDHERIATEISSKIDILRYFKKYMSVGYYPFYKTMTVNDYYVRLSRVVNTIIENDIPSTTRDIEYQTLVKVKRLLRMVAGGTPYTPNITALSGLMECSRAQLLKLLDLLDRAGLITQIYYSNSNLRSLAKPQKILLNNSVLMNVFDDPDKGAIRETIFVSFLNRSHEVNCAKTGDFIIDGRYLFEIGGKNKKFNQIRDIPDSFLTIDDVAVGFGNKIPLWLFGFLL